MKDEISARIVKEIRERRSELGFTQEYMATRLGMGQNCYSKIELGQNKLTVDRVFAICDVLGLAPEDMLGEQPNRSSDFSSLFYDNPEPMWVFEHASLRFLDVNDAAIRSYGYSRKDFMSMTLYDIRRKEDFFLFRQTLKEIETGKTNFGASRHQTRCGAIKDIMIHCYPVKHKHGIGQLAVPKLIKSGLSELQLSQNRVTRRNTAANAGNGHERLRLAELQLLAGQLDTSMSATARKELIAQMRMLLAEIEPQPLFHTTK